jgi:trimeric autotransporter adhesin
MNHTNRSLLAAAAPLAAFLLTTAGCSTRTYVSATGSTPPQFTHVYITTQAIWLNESSSAGPDDGGWSQYPLTTPVTVDLITATNGTLEQIIGGLSITPGTYHEIELIPVPYEATAGAVAQAAGASYDQEVDYVDSTGNAHQVQLQILNPDKGITIPGSLTVPVGTGAGLGAGGLGTSTASTTTGTTSTGSLFGSSSSSASTGLGLGGSASSNTQPVNFAINFNGATDLALFSYGSGAVGAVLNAHASAYDLSQSGGISGTLSLTVPNGYTNASARPNIVATAESLSADGTRHVAVLNAPVNSDGSFLLFPLPASNDINNPTYYDVVIHGAGIQTMIVKSVEVTLSTATSSNPFLSPETSTATAAPASATATANTSLGTLVPVAAGSFTAGITTTPQATLPAGAAVAFYQTLPGSSEVPYVIEMAAIDPINRTLVLPQPLSSGQVQSGTYTNTSTLTTTVDSTGQTLTLTAANPQEGAGTYKVGGVATLFGEASLGTTVSAPTSSSSSSSSSSSAAQVTPAALPVESGAASAAITATVTVSSPGAYNGGELFVSQGGTVIASTPLSSSVLAAGGTVTLSGLPSGISQARYYLSTLVWNTSDPTSLTPQSYPTEVDLSGSSGASVQVAIN